MTPPPAPRKGLSEGASPRSSSLTRELGRIAFMEQWEKNVQRSKALKRKISDSVDWEQEPPPTFLVGSGEDSHEETCSDSSSSTDSANTSNSTGYSEVWSFLEGGLRYGIMMDFLLWAIGGGGSGLCGHCGFCMICRIWILIDRISCFSINSYDRLAGAVTDISEDNIIVVGVGLRRR